MGFKNRSYQQLAIVALSIFMLLSFPAKAQTDSTLCKTSKYEISVGYGRGTVLQVFDYYGHDHHRWWKGNIHVQYLYNIKNGFGIGVSLDYTHSYLPIKDLRFKFDDKDRFIGGYIHYDRKNTDWFTISTVGRRYWFVKQSFSMYSKLGFGMVLARGSEKGVYFTPNASPVAYEYGNSRLKVYMELFSIGTNGIFNVGLTYAF